jgi:hypothetical protein
MQHPSRELGDGIERRRGGRNSLNLSKLLCPQYHQHWATLVQELLPLWTVEGGNTQDLGHPENSHLPLCPISFTSCFQDWENKSRKSHYAYANEWDRA